ncbi:MAG TPA: hypothetical protein VE907_01705 [Gammaproteobacteria bacterium]|nr:hypothetical protein [Gammaproteobacteria bacterium]
MNVHSKPRSSKPLAAALAALAFAASLASAQQQPAPKQVASAAAKQPFFAEQSTTLAATVAAIDAAKRLITLKVADGREETVEAGPAVRNFAQIKVGDKVDVEYYQSLAAEITKAPASTSHDAAVLASRTAEGASPAGGVGMIYTAIVTVTSVDAATGRVSFTGPEGRERETTAQRDAGRAFVAQLKPGDRVEITYGEALAVAVRPAAR